MLTSARVVFDCPLDQDTLHALFELRLTRLALAEAQFANISQTVEDLISRRLIDKSEKGAYHLDLHIAPMSWSSTLT